MKKTKPIIVAFSGKALAGKDSSANFLAEILHNKGKRVLRLGYGDDVKFVAALYIEQPFNVSRESLADNMFKKNKQSRDKWIDLGNSIRKKNPNFWCNRAIEIVDIIGENYDYVLSTDCRYENEIIAWENAGYNVLTVRVNRPNFDNELTKKQSEDESETSLDNYDFDCLITNSKDLNALKNEVNKGLGWLS